MSVAALIPVLRRPERVAPLAESFRLTAGEADRLMFLCSLDDLAELEAVVSAGHTPQIVSWKPGRADWARKINWGFRRAVSLGFEWMLLGADDVRFHPGWIEAALTAHAETGACVIGTNDLGNPTVKRGLHSCHPLVHRDYLGCGTIDEDAKVVTEAYHHNFVDAELVATAKAWNTWAFAVDAVVEHLHWAWRKGEDDEVYALGRARYREDERLFREREGLWT